MAKRAEPLTAEEIEQAKKARNEYQREYYKRWRAANPDKVKEYQKKWVDNNEHHIKAYRKKYRKKNPDKIREINLRYFLKRKQREDAEKAAAVAAVMQDAEQSSSNE